MSITILTGPPGHGKTYTSVKLIDEFVSKGKSVGTNVALRSDWAEQMARYHTPFGFIRKKRVARRAADYRTRVYVCEDIGELTRIRFSGDKEGRGKVIIEEAHRHMNVRGGKGSEKEERKKIVEYASGHRHYGADVILITQAKENIDLHIRNLHEFHAEVRNLRKLPLLGLLIRLIPGGQLFIRRTFWSDRAKTKAGVSMYGLSKRLACLYDTHSLEHTDWPQDAIILPLVDSTKVSRPTHSSETVTPNERRRLRKKEKRLEGRAPQITSGRPREVLRWISEVEGAMQ